MFAAQWKSYILMSSNFVYYICMVALKVKVLSELLIFVVNPNELFKMLQIYNTQCRQFVYFNVYF